MDAASWELEENEHIIGTIIAQTKSPKNPCKAKVKATEDNDYVAYIDRRRWLIADDSQQQQ